MIRDIRPLLPVPRDRPGVDPRFGPKSNGGLAFHKECKSATQKARQLNRAFEIFQKIPDQIGRTSSTSGTKWRRRFWMPCWSVAVEDGQPAQAPRIER